MRIFVTGATGFTGSHTIPLLLEQGWEVHCLYRETSNRAILPQPEIHWHPGSLENVPELTDSMRGCQNLVNIASLGFGHAGNIIQAAKTAGVKRAIFISTTAIFTKLNSKSKSTRLAAEAAIQNSNLDFTILRPTMIFGSPRDRNMIRLVRWLLRLPIIPVLGNGEYLQQPVFVDDVAEAITCCLKEPITIGKSYNIAGKNPISYNEVIDTISKVSNRKIYKIHFPYKPIIELLRIVEKVKIPLPIKAEQVERLNENKDFTYDEAASDFGYSPRSFDEAISLEIKNLRGKA